MTDNLGELRIGKILLAIVIGIAVGWLVYSRFTFQQESAAADKSAAVERALKETKDDAASLRRRVEEIERRLPPSPTNPSPGNAKRGKAK
jgi:hypothetical protein